MSKGTNGHQPSFSGRFTTGRIPPSKGRGGKSKGCAVVILLALALSSVGAVIAERLIA